MTRKPTYEKLERRIKELEAEAVDRTATVESLQMSLKKYRAAFETAKDAIFLADKTGRFIDVNQAACESLGYSKKELLQRRITDLDTDQRNYEEFLKVRDGLAEKVTLEVNQRKKDGTLLPVEITGSFFECQGQRMAVAIARDITERQQAEEILQKANHELEQQIDKYSGELAKANEELLEEISELKLAEKALRESEAQKKAILDASVDRIRLVDIDLRIIWANKTTTRELYMDPEDLVGQPCYVVFHDRDTPCALCPSKKALSSGNIEHQIIHHQDSKGIEGETHWDNYSVPIKNKSGDIIHLIQIARNITERVKAEQALTEREKELMIQTKSVEETNTALRVLLNRKGEDKAALEEKVLSNVKELVMPFLEKVKKTQLNRKQVSYIDILELNLNDIISPFLQNFSVKYASLTPAELQVASLVRHGVPSKEIANIFDVSKRTIDSHRANIRKKLKIKNKKF